ncbi:UDP-N-acetylglucosamine--N-acetylmuramyl-(pentapeptide) pyrophosphoryl-undecaprenol NAG transferase [Minicystis rosea]|nr:UDP-N-acetylglucosamine--N-acetylmuramyl-(pentapeptide) pyrophosphoryl-undecaprenol NAG transferase [Minicystis rosea]
MTTVLIAGGGTGGHVYPMLAVGDAVRALEPTARVVYVGTPRGIEGRAIGSLGEELHLLDIAPLRGDGLGGFVKGVARAAGSIPEARALVRRLRPDVALSAGGYAGGPIALAARLHGVPVTLLEPNSVLGLSNRLLTPFAERAYVAFPEAERFLRPSTVRRFGVPLRRAFTPSPYTAPPGPMRILVLGGSQGAKGINEAVPRAFASAISQGADITVTHQTGRERDAEVRALYASLGLAARADVVPYIDDVAAAITSADLIVGRSGASCLAEIGAVGRASVLIPFPFAADNHQFKNAKSLEDAGAAIAIAQAEATPERVASEIILLAKDHDRRTRMARAAMSLGKPEAARSVAADLLELASHRKVRQEEAS